ncbi:MAG: hypothetical protein RIA69_08915 [Cyclobacteriaceae bacterium]
MAVTRLERKGRKNKSRAKARVATIKRLNTLPTIKNVDIEAIKAEFAANKEAAKEVKSTVKEDAPKSKKAEKAEVTEEIKETVEKEPESKEADKEAE